MGTARRILILLAIGAALGATANAFSPRGLSWSRPLGRGIADQVTDAGMVPVGLEDVRKMIGNKSIRIVDVRTPEEFAIGRLPGAVNNPWRAEIVFKPPSDPRGWELDRPIVLYCANEFCDQSLLMGKGLRSMGYRDIAVFVEGYEAWWNAGGPVDQD